MAALYKTEFETAGFLVEIAADGELGLTKAQKIDPQVIILDLILPKISGLELLRQLKKTPATQGIPTFILTNFGQEENVRLAYENGAEDIFFKYQITPQEVVQKIKTALEVKK